MGQDQWSGVPVSQPTLPLALAPAIQAPAHNYVFLLAPASAFQPATAFSGRAFSVLARFESMLPSHFTTIFCALPRVTLADLFSLWAARGLWSRGRPQSRWVRAGLERRAVHQHLPSPPPNSMACDAGHPKHARSAAAPSGNDDGLFLKTRPESQKTHDHGNADDLLVVCTIGTRSPTSHPRTSTSNQIATSPYLDHIHPMRFALPTHSTPALGVHRAKNLNQGKGNGSNEEGAQVYRRTIDPLLHLFGPQWVPTSAAVQRQSDGANGVSTEAEEVAHTFEVSDQTPPRDNASTPQHRRATTFWDLPKRSGFRRNVDWGVREVRKCAAVNVTVDLMVAANPTKDRSEPAASFSSVLAQRACGKMGLDPNAYGCSASELYSIKAESISSVSACETQCACVGDNWGPKPV
ncbi:hypothetical protein BJY52DRAFT_1224276 [Lactarius psammicola]|nr:hypothetical protein BJY52DRAFT_1224276 [Lactarius psammicola]